MRDTNIKIYGITLTFMALLFFPLLNQSLELIKDSESFENRTMAAEPELDPELLDPFPSHYEKYYNDHFTLRNSLIKCYNTYGILAYNKSPFPEKVVIGKKNWLFSGEHMESYKSINMFSNAELEILKNELEYRSKYLAERGCKFIFVIAPIKANIYPELMPYDIRHGDMSWGEQVNGYLSKNSRLALVNLFTSFRKNKNAGDLYHKNDTHWNDLGALYASNTIITYLNNDLPGLKPLPLSDFILDKSKSHTGNLQQILGNMEIFTDNSSISPVPKKGFIAKEVDKQGYPAPATFPYPYEYERDMEIKNSAGPTMLIITDSFGAQIFPYLAENFSRTVKIFDNWEYHLKEDIVDKEKPAVMLLLINEPALKNFVKLISRPRIN